MATNNYIELKNITKTFGGVVALKNVSLSICKGDCFALMGENGAGKSTLGKILAGIHKADSGETIINGKIIQINSPRDAFNNGISMVHQELSFCPDLSIAENLMLGKYPLRWGIKIDNEKMLLNAEQLLKQIELDINPNELMKNLSTAQNQMIQIANAIATGSDIIIFDEPTSSLSEKEVVSLFKLIKKLKEQNITLIYVSHRMDEIFEICNKVAVLRDGEYVDTCKISEVTKAQLIEKMIGRKIEEYFPSYLDTVKTDVILKVENLSSKGKFEDISFELHAGEILGFAGLVGAGRSEIAVAIFGLDNNVTGNVTIDGNKLSLNNVDNSLENGIVLVPEDRKLQGLALGLSCKENFSLPNLNQFSKLGVLNKGLEQEIVNNYFSKVSVKTDSVDSAVENLSGGNQQKIVLAKWIAHNSKLLIVDEPTRGIDIGSKTAIHNIIDELAQTGMGIVLISSELPEVINLSSRIIVMRNGKMVKEFTRGEANQDLLLRYMTGNELNN